MALSVGIVGLPNVGKSTVFNALTAGKAEAANYPFCTIDPNVGIVPVPDARLAAHPEAHQDPEGHPGDRRDRRHRRPGQGRVAGRGPRQQVPRQHPRDQRDPDDGALLRRSRTSSTSRARSIRCATSTIIELELALADVDTAEKRAQEGAGRGQDRQQGGQGRARARREGATRTSQAGKAGAHARRCPTTSAKMVATFGLLTAKPVLYCCNVGEDDLPSGQRVERPGQARAPRREGAGVVVLCGKIEAELAELGEAERGELLASYGLEEPALAHARARVLPPARPAVVLHRRREGDPRLDDPQGRARARGRRRDPHRLREGLHPRAGLLARRPRAARQRGRASRPPASCAWKARTYVVAGRRHHALPVQRVDRSRSNVTTRARHVRRAGEAPRRSSSRMRTRSASRS